MAIDWTDLHKKYKGLWIALKQDEKTVVGSGTTVMQALAVARKAGYAQPIVFRMPKKILPFIGGHEIQV